MTQRTTTVFERQLFKMMDALQKNVKRDLNYYSFTPEMMQKIFGLEPNHAKELLSLWVKNHNLEGDYEIITV